jgi:transcriptional regulator with XRE-family HTH domain
MSVNERLRSVLRQRDVSVDELAASVGVDPKTIGRWVTTGRVPHPRHRKAAVALLGVGEDHLWPKLKEKDPLLASNGETEITATYADRSSVPRDVWLQLVNSATSNIDILVFSGTFLAQTNPRFPQMLIDRAAIGAEIRLCFGDPDGSAVALRDEEEGIRGTLGSKIRACLSYFTDLLDTPNCEIRLHNATLYASIFRYDGQAMINPHIWGSPASANPMFQVRQISADCMFEKYLRSFDRVWEQSKPWIPTP